MMGYHLQQVAAKSSSISAIQTRKKPIATAYFWNCRKPRRNPTLYVGGSNK